MAFTGLVPSEYSSGGAARRGHITKTGNAHLRTQLIESAWAYQHRPIIGTALCARQIDLPADTLARSWTAQLRLCRRFRALGARKNIKGVVVTAIARELAGFLWAEMTHTPMTTNPREHDRPRCRAADRVHGSRKLISWRQCRALFSFQMPSTPIGADPSTPAPGGPGHRRCRIDPRHLSAAPTSRRNK
jgi:Transposase IS116/IS110/IS902 family